MDLRLKVASYIRTEDLPLSSVLAPDDSILDFKIRAADFLADRGRQIRGVVHPTAIIEGDVVIELGAQVGPNVVIIGPVYVGTGATLRNGAFIRDTSVLFPGATVGFAVEVSRSMMLPGSEALHHAIVADSLLGRDVSLAGGTFLANVPVSGDRGSSMKNIKIRTVDGDIDTGFTKFGSVLGDGTRTGAHVVLNPGTLFGPNSRIYADLVSPSGIYRPSTSFNPVRGMSQSEAKRR